MNEYEKSQLALKAGREIGRLRDAAYELAGQSWNPKIYSRIYKIIDELTKLSHEAYQLHEKIESTRIQTTSTYELFKEYAD